MNNKPLIIRIPEPCHEDWENMLPESQGRFCSACNKTVYDFSRKTDREIYNILISKSNEQVCGRFKKTQVDRPLNFSVDLNRLPKRIDGAKVFAIAVFLVFGTFLFSCETRHGKKITRIEITNLREQQLPPGTIDTLSKSLYTVTGEFVSQQENVLLNNNYVAGGLRFVHPGIADTLNEIEDVQEEANVECRTMGLMELQQNEIPDTSFMRPEDSLSAKINPVENVLLTPTGQAPGFSIFPNPGVGEFTISYTLFKKSDVRIDIYDLHGAWIKTLVDIKEQYASRYQLPFNLNELAGGTYLVNMLNEGNRFTQRLIIAKL